MVSSRLKIQYCKVIIITSLVWFLLDVFLLMYFTDCTMTGNGCQNNNIRTNSDDKDKSGNIFNRILPNETAPPKTVPTNLILNVKDRKFKNVLKSKSQGGPGELGKPVVISAEKQGEMREKFKINQFNVMASDMISLNRSLPDVRMDKCKVKTYGPISELPDTSIVIVFHNEAWSTLLRTVHSVINRSPRSLLREIILVDDASERDFLGKQLEDYMKRLLVPVYVERMGIRSGLIRARLRGASRAQGKVITFLDAHCECTEGWLEPLLYEIKLNRKSVVCPIIDVISDETFEYITGSDMTWGGFNWKLNFRWYPVPHREVERRGGDRSIPLRSPTMAGGLLSIERDYFYEIGSYDSGMDIWGGENLEMSFRIWMCQGTLLIVTCSHVGHVFRKATPYSFPGGTGRIINHNNARLAEVWMDEWREFYYKINPGVTNSDYGDLTDRKNLREKLQCKSFRWYLENVYPESQMPLDYFSLGEIRNKESGLCLDSMGRKQGEKVGMVRCHGLGGNQVFSLTKKHQIMTSDGCLELAKRGGAIKMTTCHGKGGNQMWSYEKGTSAIRHVNSDQCLDKPQVNERDVPSIGPCTGSSSQQWLLGEFDWNKLVQS